MKERPILFSGPMVRAILEGRKTQTRRVIKPQPTERPLFGTHGNGRHVWYQDDADNLYCPYGQPGDRLWVRETFTFESNRDADSSINYPPPFRDGRPIEWHNHSEYGEYWVQPHYRATDPEPELHYGLDEPGCKWRPSIHMPRWASRLTLEITGVRVERVQDISVEDVIAEGITTARMMESLTENFRLLWNEINAKRGYSFESNPFVWVISFRRI